MVSEHFSIVVGDDRTSTRRLESVIKINKAKLTSLELIEVCESVSFELFRRAEAEGVKCILVEVLYENGKILRFLIGPREGQEFMVRSALGAFHRAEAGEIHSRLMHKVKKEYGVEAIRDNCFDNAFKILYRRKMNLAESEYAEYLKAKAEKLEQSEN